MGIKEIKERREREAREAAGAQGHSSALARLEVDDFVHQRDADGNLVPIEYEITELKGTVLILPMDRASVQKYLREVAALQVQLGKTKGVIEQQKKDLDFWLIETFVLEPKFVAADCKALKMVQANALARGVLKVAGVVDLIKKLAEDVATAEETKKKSMKPDSMKPISSTASATSSGKSPG